MYAVEIAKHRCRCVRRGRQCRGRAGRTGRARGRLLMGLIHTRSSPLPAFPLIEGRERGNVEGLLTGNAEGTQATDGTLEGTITGCYKADTPNKGALRVIDAEAGQECAATARALTWSADAPVSVLGGHSQNFNVSPDATIYVDLFGGQVCNAAARCEQSAPTDLALANPHLRVFSVVGHVSTALLVNGVAHDLDCEAARRRQGSTHGPDWNPKLIAEAHHPSSLEGMSRAGQASWLRG